LIYWRRKPTAIVAVLVFLFTFTFLTFSPVAGHAQTPDKSGNPLTEAQQKKETAPPVLPGPNKLPDYRSQGDAQRMREPVTGQKALSLFGYSFFQPARQTIEARRAYLRLLLSGGIQPFTTTPAKPQSGAETPSSPASALPPTKDEIDAVLALTDAQKADLLARQKLGTLTDFEKLRYRLLFESGTLAGAGQIGKTAVSALPPTKDEVDAVLALTDAQKADLLARQKLGTLTDFEKLRYRLLFESGTLAGAGQTGTTTSSQPTTVSQPGIAGNETIAPTPPVNAFQEIADPLAQLYQNVLASVPANYQLNPGDYITLRYWSPTMEQQETSLLVDPQGAITVPVVGRLIVRGQTVGQAEALLRGRMRRLFKDVEVSVTLKELRTIPITMSGASFYPGTYTVPAVVTAINMIYVTGGPTEEGTLRRIEVRRNGKLVGLVDFYKFLLTGEETGGIALQPGDVIYIPGRGPRVTMRGQVRHPAIYELTDGETLKDALRYAGGVNPSGVEQRVQVLTLQPGAARVLKDVDVTKIEQEPPVAVYDSDTVEVFSVRSTLTNKVTVEGAVDQPGEYEITPNMTVADLVEHARGLLSDAYPTLAHLYRVNPDNTLTQFSVNLEKALARDPAHNLPLTRWDRLTVYTRQEVAWTGRREVTVRGAVARPGIYYRSDNMRVKDLLLQAGGTLPEAYSEQAVLLHQRGDGSYAYEYVSLNQALKDDPKHNALMQDRDILAVYTVQEAQFTPQRTVSLAGEAVAPGTYPRGEGMRLSDLLKLAGGVTPRAADSVQIAHSRRDVDQKPTVVRLASGGVPAPDPLLEDGDLVTIQGRGAYQEKPIVVYVEGRVNRPGPVILKDRATRLSDVVAMAGGLDTDAYPEGTEFYRDPALLETAGQKQIAQVINQLNLMINQAEFKRAQAKSDIERIKAIGAATRSQAPIPIPSIMPSVETLPLNPAAEATNIFRRDLVSPPRELTDSDLEPKGNVAINLPAALRKPNSEDDILMVDGDRVTVPEKPKTIQVIGAVIHQRAVLYRSDARLDYYIAAAGGYAPDAAKDRAVVIRLGGGLTPIKKIRAFMPGDVILVPTQVMAEKITTRQNDIDTIFRGLTSSAVIILVAKKLLGL
jgi:polysaccharide export outer membrane protein